MAHRNSFNRDKLIVLGLERSLIQSGHPADALIQVVEQIGRKMPADFNKTKVTLLKATLDGYDRARRGKKPAMIGSFRDEVNLFSRRKATVIEHNPMAFLEKAEKELREHIIREEAFLWQHVDGNPDLSETAKKYLRGVVTACVGPWLKKSDYVIKVREEDGAVVVTCKNAKKSYPLDLQN